MYPFLSNIVLCCGCCHNLLYIASKDRKKTCIIISKAAGLAIDQHKNSLNALAQHVIHRVCHSLQFDLN